MTTQESLFPQSEIDGAVAVLNYLLAERDKAEKAVDSAQDRLDGAVERVRDQNVVVSRLQRTSSSKSILETATDMVNSGALDTDGMTVTATVSPHVDPIAGEVTALESAAAAPVVIALWPGDPEPHVTEIGEHTTYLELIADYCTAVDGFAGGLDDFVVIGEDDLAERRSDNTIGMIDYGRRLVVAAREAVEA